MNAVKANVQTTPPKFVRVRGKLSRSDSPESHREKIARIALDSKVQCEGLLENRRVVFIAANGRETNAKKAFPIM
jgi:hypothetical protein